MLPRKYWYPVILFTCLAIIVSSCGSSPIQKIATVGTPATIWSSPEPTLFETLPAPANRKTTAAGTPEPTGTQTPSPGTNLTQAQAAVATHVFPTPAGSFSEILSPDGKWVIFVRNKDLKVIQASGKVVWTLEFKQWQANYLRLVGWSADGRYLYFTAQRFVRTGVVAFVDGFILERLDLESGSIKEILPASFYTLSMSLSPDSSLLAYIYQGKDPLDVSIRDLNTGKEQAVKLDRDLHYGGNMVWSQDQKTLVLTATNDNPKYMLYTVVKVDLSSFTQTVLVHEDRRFLTAVRWGKDGRVLLTEQNHGYWWMDLKTGVLETVKETPAPGS